MGPARLILNYFDFPGRDRTAGACKRIEAATPWGPPAAETLELQNSSPEGVTMKKPMIATLAVALTVGLTLTSVAQPPERGRRGDGEGPPPGRGDRAGQMRERMGAHPLVVALDTDGDGELSADEIANAAAALKKLDRNEDGKIDRREMLGGMRGPGGPGGPAGPGGPGAGRRPGGAGPGGRQRDPAAMVERMMQRDKNDDGFLAGDEIPERMEAMLVRLDTDEDGKLSREELEAMAGRAGREGGGPGGARRGRRGGPGGGPDGPPNGNTRPRRPPGGGGGEGEGGNR